MDQLNVFFEHLNINNLVSAVSARTQVGDTTVTLKTIHDTFVREHQIPDATISTQFIRVAFREEMGLLNTKETKLFHTIVRHLALFLDSATPVVTDHLTINLIKALNVAMTKIHTHIEAQYNRTNSKHSLQHVHGKYNHHSPC